MDEGDTVVKTLGKGGQGSVDLVKHKGQYLARKSIKITGIEMVNCLKEVEILQMLRDRKVLIYKDNCYNTKDKIYYIYTEYFKKGDLHHLIKNQNHKDFDDKKMVKFIKNLIKIVKYVHAKGIIHRDLKPENILVTDENTLVIGDFGLAIEKDGLNHPFEGTLMYIAPELYENKENPPYSEKSDVFAVGCIIYEIYTLRKLYNGKSKEDIKNRIVNDYEISFKRNNLERNYSIEKLIMKMIEKDPMKRISLNQIDENLCIKPEQDEPHVSIHSVPSNTTVFQRQDSLAVGFYLLEQQIEGLSLTMMSEFSQNEFNSNWNDNFVLRIFPVVGQDNPPFSIEDLTKLKERRCEYKDKLVKILNMIRNLPDNRKNGIIDYIELFLDSIRLSYSFHGSSNFFNNEHNISLIEPPPPLPPPAPQLTSSAENSPILSQQSSLEATTPLEFYLQNKKIGGKSFSDLHDMDKNEFNRVWKYEFASIVFPVVGQENPPFSIEDLTVLKSNKPVFEENLKRLLYLLNNLPEDMIICITEPIELFLYSIELHYSFNEIQPPPPLPPKVIPVYQRGDLHPSRWVHTTDVEIPNCPSQVTSLYYERPDEGNRLLSVNGEPSGFRPSGVVQGSSGLSSEFLRKIGFGNWWCETKEEEFKYVPVYQRGGKHPSKWIFKENVPIKKEYKDIIKSLHYARSDEGNELLSVNGEPDFYHLDGGQVRGAERLPREYLNKMSQFGWWRY